MPNDGKAKNSTHLWLRRIWMIWLLLKWCTELLLEILISIRIGASLITSSRMTILLSSVCKLKKRRKLHWKALVILWKLSPAWCVTRNQASIGEDPIKSLVTGMMEDFESIHLHVGRNSSEKSVAVYFGSTNEMKRIGHGWKMSWTWKSGCVWSKIQQWTVNMMLLESDGCSFVPWWGKKCVGRTGSNNVQCADRQRGRQRSDGNVWLHFTQRS